MDKKALAQRIIDQNYVDTKKASAKIIDEIFEVMGAALAHGEEVSLHGFGKFKTVKREACLRKNPSTGETIQCPSHSVVKFVPAKPLKDAVR